MKITKKKIISVAISAITALSAVTCFASPSNSEGVLDSENTIVYNGSAIEPDVQMFSSGTQLVNGTDYDLTYENNTNVGEATINITFKGNYTGTRAVTFNIVAQELTNNDVTITTIENQTYTGSEIKPTVTIKIGDVTLVEGTDFDVTYTDNTNVGTATATITFKGNYTGTATTQFEITAATINPDLVNYSAIDAQTYTGSAITPEPTITYDGKTLTKNTDYELTYSDNVNVGTATVNVTFKGNYSGTSSTTFQIVAKAVTEQNVTIAPIEDQKYTGKAITPEPVITDIGV